MGLWLYLSAVLVCLCVFADLAIAQKKKSKLPSQEFKGYGGLPAKVKSSPTASYKVVSVDNTVRVFLGTQIGCAQCHDHPFDRWTQKDFY